MNGIGYALQFEATRTMVCVISGSSRFVSDQAVSPACLSTLNSNSLPDTRRTGEFMLNVCLLYFPWSCSHLGTTEMPAVGQVLN